jgi:spore coat polysaccharide biosynthesis protein SpsF
MNNVIKYLPRKKKQIIGVVIQARMTSVRFPGKSMALLNGKPVLQHVIERALQIRGEKGIPIDYVIVAVPDTEDSEPMIQLAEKLGVKNFCGDENDVLARYHSAARCFNLDIILRITADCPYFNPYVSSEVLQLLLWRKLDYCSNCYPKRTYPKGYDTEAFTYDCLDAAFQLATTDEQKEHVTTWMVENLSKLNTACVAQHKNKSHLDLCVDNPEDIERIEKLSADWKWGHEPIKMQPIKVSV